MSLSTESLDAPFFIVGAPRSGTTLLRLMLAAHPRLAIPPESHFIPPLLRLERQAGSLTAMRDRVIEWLVAHPRLADFRLGPDFIRQSLRTLHPFCTRTIVLSLFREYARCQGKVRWGDKTPRYRAFVADLSALFPDARFIHLLRDGRDAALSSLRANFGPRNWTQAVYLWRASVRTAWQGMQCLPEVSRLELRYESLLDHPQETLRRVCGFLGEDFSPQMLQFSRQFGELVPSWERPWHSKLARELDRGNAGKWRSELTPDQIVLFQQVAGKELTAAGYPLQRLPFDAATYARNCCRRMWYLSRVVMIQARDRVRPGPSHKWGERTHSDPWRPGCAGRACGGFRGAVLRLR